MITMQKNIILYFKDISISIIFLLYDQKLELAYNLKYHLDTFYKNSSSDNTRENIDELITLFRTYYE